MNSGSRGALVALASVALSITLSASSQQNTGAERSEDRRPKITLRARPPVGISPARIVFTVELTGGANDYEEFYCPTIEWEWGDGTTSESTYDCEPYVAGTSEIRRRYTAEHTYRRSGGFKAYFKLKRRDKNVAAASATVQVRPGVRDY